MKRTTRTDSRWNPEDALRERFGRWTVQVVDGMADVEMIIPVAQTCLVDKATHDADPELMLAHLYGHLVLHEEHEGQFSEAEEDEADDLADIMLDRKDDAYWDRLWAKLDAEQDATVIPESFE